MVILDECKLFPALFFSIYSMVYPQRIVKEIRTNILRISSICIDGAMLNRF